MKRKMMSKLIACVMTVAMIAAATGCGSTSANEGSSTEETKATEEASQEVDQEKTQDAQTASGDVNLSIMWWGSDARHEATQAVLDLYTAQTGIAFTPEYTGWDGYWQKLPVLAASNSMTDVLQMDAAYIHQYVDNGQLADLTDLVDLSNLLSQEEIDAIKINGKIYGIPLSRNGQGFVYSKTALQQYGIEEPKNAWSWDEMIEWAKAAKEKLPEGVYPIPDFRGQYNCYQEYAQSQGCVKPLDGNSFNFDIENYKKFNELFASFVEEGLCPPAEVTLSHVELDPVNDNFVNGKVLLRSVAVGSVASLAAMIPDQEIGCICLPQGNGGSGWCQSTIFFAVGANSQNIKEAADFIQYFITDLEAGKTLKTVRGLPLSDEVYDSFSADLDASAQYSKIFYDAITADGVRFNPYWDDVPTAFTDWGTEFKAQEEALILGQTSVEEAASYLDELGKEAASTAQ